MKMYKNVELVLEKDKDDKGNLTGDIMAIIFSVPENGSEKAILEIYKSDDLVALQELIDIDFPASHILVKDANNKLVDSGELTPMEAAKARYL